MDAFGGITIRLLLNIGLLLLGSMILSCSATQLQEELNYNVDLDQNQYELRFESRKMNPPPYTPSSDSKLKKIVTRNLQSLEVPNYDFEYQIHGGGNDFGHVEKRRETTTSGKYYVVLPDFRKQVVSYYSDETGYHATITYEPLPGAQQFVGTNEIAPRSSAIKEVRDKDSRRVVPRARKVSFNKTERRTRYGGIQHQHKKQTRETPAEQILYALAQFEEHRHRQSLRNESARTYTRT